jgi:indole-3-glycerol phosphate synthase
MLNKSQFFLEEIIALKKKDIDEKKSISSFAFRDMFLKKKISLIAEIKFASPTNPNLGSHEDLLKRAMQYEKAGADAISLITEKHYFKGDGKFIAQVKKEIDLPVLQKDFIIDLSQIFEAKELGSDALLLIARLVDKKQLIEFVDICFSLEIEPVVEVNNEEDLNKAVATKTNIIAVNARNLETFEINIAKACLLLEKIPDRFSTLGFSGIHSFNEVVEYKKAGVNGVLIGTELMKTNDINGFIKSLKL